MWLGYNGYNKARDLLSKPTPTEFKTLYAALKRDLPRTKAEYDKKWTALSNKSYAAEKAAKAEKTNKEILKNSDYVPEYKKTTVGNETQVFYYENGEWVHFGAYKYVPSRKGYEVWLNKILYYKTMKDAVAALYTYKKYNLIRTKGHIL